MATEKPEAKKTEEQPEQAAAQAQPAQPQQQVQLDDSNVNSCYANFCRVTGTPEELIIDFGLNTQPVGVPEKPIRISDRIILNHFTAKRLLASPEHVRAASRSRLWRAGNRRSQARPSSRTAGRSSSWRQVSQEAAFTRRQASPRRGEVRRAVTREYRRGSRRAVTREYREGEAPAEPRQTSSRLSRSFVLPFFWAPSLIPCRRSSAGRRPNRPSPRRSESRPIRLA